MNKFFIPFFLFCFFILKTSAQDCQSPIPDDCSTACNLGALPAPVPCNGTLDTSYGSTVSFNLSNIGATASSPYSTLQGCAGPAEDVWYMFTATGTVLNLQITNSTLNNPNVSLYVGSNCNNLIGQTCFSDTGTNLSATFNWLAVDSVYYLQISGGTTYQDGNFTLTLQNWFDCNRCLLGETFTAAPVPVSGAYTPGQTVSFCYTVTNYNQTAVNWLHGIVFDFGPGWDQSTLTATSIPLSCDPSLGAHWGFYDTVTSQETGEVFGPGFFYETSMGANADSIDGDPGNNYGDDGVGITCPVTFCWTINTRADCANGTDLHVAVKTLGDYQSGSWQFPGCLNDPVAELTATLSCCTSPTITVGNPNCVENTGWIIAAETGVGPWKYTWKNRAGQTIQYHNNITAPDTIDNLSSGQYFLTSVDSNDCSSSGIANLYGHIVTVTNPLNQSLDGPGNAQFFVSASDTGGLYQWQSNTGTGWKNISDTGQYLGTTSDSLIIANVTEANNLQQFRCVVAVSNCVDTTEPGILSVAITGIVNAANDNSFTVQPNPAVDDITVKLNSNTYTEIKIFDALGQAIYMQPLNIGEQKQQLHINTTNIANGIYILQITGAKGIANKRVVVQK